ncbi:Hsp33 family molecular chaperone HslO [Marinomonas sp. 2405UD68-3]|uniref:Hsp33 family molecular chaperone HslO n=1 Tax=Marinomonas sp. 2405UD68-3 TaxID=3391835 RepID=UPI0039C97BDB
MNEIQRFSFDNTNVRGERVILTDAYQDIIKRKNYPLSIEKLLGEFVAAIALLRDIVKIDGVLSMQAKGNGFLETIMAECDELQNLRGIAQWDETQSVPNEIDLQDALKDGYLVITITPKNGSRYQGIVELVGSTLSECIAQYFLQSEQLPSRVWLACDGTACGGLFLQSLPEGQDQDSNENEDKDAWTRITHLASTVKQEELLTLQTEALLHRLYHEEVVLLYSPKEMQFGCSCSRQRTLEAMASINADELREILIEQGSISTTCAFCAETYDFTENELSVILGDQAHTH